LANRDSACDSQHLEEPVRPGQHHDQSTEKHIALGRRVLPCRMESREEVVHGVLAIDEDAKCQEDTGKAQRSVNFEFSLLNQPGL
jgi:hypothetical protein